jgi:prepilin-type N-terminal cleavage/methylation domain-containing protein
MKTKKMIRNQKGFTLIEIIAVLVILGILAAVAIPKYLDMRSEAVTKAAGTAKLELNARERLKLAEWKLNDGLGTYPLPNVAAAPAPSGKPIGGVDTILGPDWYGGAPIVSGTAFSHQGKTITFTRAVQLNDNESATWSVTVT